MIEAIKQGGVPLPTFDETSLPEINQSNFPVINQPASAGTTRSNLQLAQALNLFNKGGIVSAKKSQ